MDWSKTALGPLETWPQSLRTSVSLCLSSTFPILICWGPDDIQIYNDSYTPICGDLHPRSMGMPFKVCWEAALPVVGDKFDRAHLGEGTYINNQRMFLERYGYLEEAWMTFSFGAIRDESGRVGGIFHPITETTHAMLGARRTQVLRDFAASLGPAKTVEQIAELGRYAPEKFELDLPFFCFYKFDEDGKSARLVGSSGIEGPLPEWPLPAPGEAYLEIGDLKGLLGDKHSGPYPEAPNTALILPIVPAGSAEAFGFLVAGVSSRRALDDEYRNFYALLANTFTTAVSNVLAYEQEQKRAQALAEIDEAKTAFFSNVSHEFRTPLTLILGPLEDSLSDSEAPLNEKQRARQVIAHRNSMRLLKLVNSLLDFSRIEAGRIQASYRPTDLARFTSDLTSGFRSATDRAGLELKIFADTLPGSFYVDHDMWEKIVLNLISNAFKFTFSGTIEVRLSSTEHGARLEVSDTGTGIPEKELPKIFERFHRVQGAKGRSFEGTGIGLALVKELARLHGGTVSVRSKEGVGTTFQVDIPSGYQHLPSEKVVHEAVSDYDMFGNAYVEEAKRWIGDSSSEIAAAKSPAQIRPRVVVADDNADMLSYVVDLLKDSYEITTAMNGVQALSAIRKLKPDLVLTDVMMPELDGFGLLKSVREDDEIAGTPIILLSARAGEEARIEGLNAGADDYMVKPFSAKELTSRIASTLKNQKTRNEWADIVRESEKRFRNMFAHAAVNIVLLNLDGTIAQVNEAYSSSLGYEPSELLGKHFSSFTHPDDVESNLQTVSRILKGEIPHATLEKRYLKRDGNPLWVQTSVSPYLNDQGEPMHLVAISQNISERKAAEEKAHRATEEAIRANQSKSAFLANMSHEIRTPMTAVLGFTELLRDDRLSDAIKKDAIGRIERSGRSLLRLIDDILDLSKVEAGKFEISKIDFSPEELAAEVVSLLKLSAEQKGVSLTLEADDRVPASACSDPARLRQVLVNLVGNAVKFTSQGSVVLKVSAGEERWLSFEVIDTGTGISEADQAKLFQPFMQADASITRQYGGTGLGLVLSKRLAFELGGDLVLAKSELGKGSVFVATIDGSPFKQQSAPRSQNVKESLAPEKISLEGVSVLVAEDTPDNQILMRRYLESAGASIEVAGNGDEAIQKVKASDFDLVLMDVQMPVLDGLTATRKLRELGYAKPILALTAHAMPEEIARSHAAGCDGHLTKPITKKDLIDAVGAAVRGSATPASL